MNTQKFLFAVSICLFTFACSSDDDNGNQQQESNEDLLVSGKWYFESKTPGSYSDCEKSGYIQFRSDGTFTIEVYEDNGGTCESLGADNGNYTLTNNVNITLTAGSETQSAVITSISQSELKITNSGDGEMLVFDKTAG
ncbi:MAG: lipocalin family protein [Gelidibacter sp.]